MPLQVCIVWAGPPHISRAHDTNLAIIYGNSIPWKYRLFTEIPKASNCKTCSMVFALPLLVANRFLSANPVSVCLFVCLSLLSDRLSACVCLFFCLSGYVCVLLSVGLSVVLSICLPVYGCMCVCLYVCIYVCLSVCVPGLSICVPYFSVCLSMPVCVSVYLCALFVCFISLSVFQPLFCCFLRSLLPRLKEQVANPLPAVFCYNINSTRYTTVDIVKDVSTDAIRGLYQLCPPCYVIPRHTISYHVVPCHIP